MKKDSQLTIRLDADTKRAIGEAAARRARSRNWLAVEILRAWLRKHHRDQQRRQRKSSPT